MSSLSTLPKGDSAWLLRKAIERIMEQVSVLETNIGSSTTGNSANTQIIFNDNGTLRGDAGLVYNKTTDALTVAGLVTAGSATITGAATVGTTLGVTGDSTLTGAVGVGATPIGKFDVYNTVSDTTVFIRSDTTKLGQIVFRDNADAGNQGKLKYDHLTDTLSLSTAATEQVFINSSGNVGIGVTPTNLAGHKRVEIKGDIPNLTLRTISANVSARDWQITANDAAFAELAFKQGASQGADPNSGTTRMVLTAAGDVSVSTGNVVMATSGKGIDFSAVTGGTGTATGNVLNDYEEGTWTPTQGAGLTVVGAFSSSGTYTKVGRLVTINGVVIGATSVAVAANSILCAGLPFSANNQATATSVNGSFTASSFCAIDAANLYAITSMVATTSIRFTATYYV